VAEEPGTPRADAALTTPQQPPSSQDERNVPWRLILLAALAIYLVLFAVLNANEENVSFVFFSIQISLIVALVVVAVLGFVAGYLTNELRDRRRQKTGAAKPRQP